MGLELNIPDELRQLLASTVPDMSGEIFNYSLAYMLPLEGLRADGSSRTPHSPLAPHGMVRKNLEVIEHTLHTELYHYLGQVIAGADPKESVKAALTSALDFGLTTIVRDTPVDTGRAVNTWQRRLPEETQPAASRYTPLKPSKYGKRAK